MTVSKTFLLLKKQRMISDPNLKYTIKQNLFLSAILLIPFLLNEDAVAT